MGDFYNGRIDRHRFEPVPRLYSLLDPWIPAELPHSMRLDRNSSTDADWHAGLEVWRPRRWYRVVVDGRPAPAPISSRWLPFAVAHLKRAGHTGRARRCEAPARPVALVHLDNGGKGRCGARGMLTTKLGAATCPGCVVDGLPAEVA